MNHPLFLVAGVAITLTGCSVTPLSPIGTHYPVKTYTQPQVQPATYKPKPYINKPTKPIYPKPTAPTHSYNQQELQWAAHRIFLNETGGDAKKLISWNDNENFLSLGIGHFIWYPRQQTARFTETFPDLLNYIQARGIAPPVWLRNRPYKGAPWLNKAAFLQAQNDRQVHELYQFLEHTKPLQAEFIAKRLQQSLPRMLQSAPAQQRSLIQRNYQTLMHTPKGLYVLLDYVNFKGEGINPTERYQGQGWGLAQVLQQMQPSPVGAAALDAFARAADDVLVQRVANNSQEARWLHGWQRRIMTYRAQALLARH